MARMSMFQLAIIGATVSLAASMDDNLPDCVCDTTWIHSEHKCGAGSALQNRTMRSCPTLEDLAVCENNPVQSWCKTTEKLCKQQVSSNFYNQGRTYCDPRSDEPQLPKCTCKSQWLLNGNETAGQNGNCLSKPMTVHGCPSENKLRLCDPTYNEGDQPYCETNEAACLEQEDDHDANGNVMVGKGWAYCSRFENKPELPRCECQSEWSPYSSACVNGTSDVTFNGCPNLDEIRVCDPKFKDTAGQTWCSTTKPRCLQQTFQEVVNGEDMIGQSWAFCDIQTNKADWPECVCKSVWQHNDNKCVDAPLNMYGCPSESELLLCEHKTARGQSHCETTYATCREQNYEANGHGWSYCDAAKNTTEIAICECDDMWSHREDTCTDVHQQFRGCPTIEELQFCEPTATSSWCKTKDQTCKGQNETTLGKGRVACDVKTQLPVYEDVSGLISTSVGVTMLVCSVFILGGILVYKRWSDNKKAGFMLLQQQRLREDSEL